MSATRLTFAGGRASLTLDATGCLLGVTHADAPGVSYLVGAADLEGRLDGRRLRWEAADVRADDDEVEVDLVATDGVRARVRHTVTPGWSTRIALRNTGTTPVALDGLAVGVSAGRDCVGWAVAAGAEGRFVVLPPEPDQPVLAGWLRSGAVRTVRADGLVCEPVRLAPGAGYVVGWEWDWVSSPAAALVRHPGAVPWRQVLLVGDVAVLDADPDAALIGGGVSTVGQRHEIEGGAGGPKAYALHSARGLVEFELEWVEPPATLLREVAGEALDGDRTTAGVPKLGGMAASLVVQHVLRSGGFERAAEAEEALELVAARLADGPRGTPFAALVLCGEYERTGDPEFLDLATDALAGVDEVVAGVGFATLRVGIASLAAGRSVPVPRSPTGQTAADLELAVVTGDLERQVDIARRLGRELGAGLPGRAAHPQPVDELAHLVSVFTLLDDRVGGRPIAEWGVSPHELAQRGLAELLARLPDRRPRAAHGWLALTVDTP